MRSIVDDIFLFFILIERLDSLVGQSD